MPFHWNKKYQVISAIDILGHLPLQQDGLLFHAQHFVVLITKLDAFEHTIEAQLCPDLSRCAHTQKLLSKNSVSLGEDTRGTE